MKKIIVALCMNVFFGSLYSQNVCGIENNIGYGTLGGDWLRQSFTLQQDIHNVQISMPCFFINPSTLKMSLYQGSVWDENPVLVASSEQWADAELEPFFPDEGYPVEYSLYITDQVLYGGQEYFIQVEDNDFTTDNPVFGYGISGTEDQFVYGEGRDPLMPQIAIDYWFPDFLFSVEGECVPCQGDFNQDGIVGISDLTMFLGNVGCVGSCGLFDLDNDSVVGTGDLVIFLARFGQSCY